MRDGSWVRRWERRSRAPLFATSSLYLTAYAVQVPVPDLSPGWQVLWRTVTAVAWSVFALDHAARPALSDDRRRFVRSRWLDLVVVLPLLRPLRVVQQIHAGVQERHERPRAGLEARVMTYAGPATLLLGLDASLAVLHDGGTLPAPPSGPSATRRGERAPR